MNDPSLYSPKSFIVKRLTFKEKLVVSIFGLLKKIELTKTYKMKNFYLLAAVLFTSSAMFGQRAMTEARENFSPAKNIKSHVAGPHGNTAIQKASGDTVFSDDFANGLAGNNGVGAWTTGGSDGALWLQDFDGPNGDFSDPDEIIVSTTVGNGFMMFDSNVSNDGCTDPGGSCITRDGWLISPVLDLTATPFVHLVFQQKYRWCCAAAAPYFVEVSSDGGATWPTRMAINLEGLTNEDFGTSTVRVNIGPGIAANPAMARFRISHDGTFTGNASHYHWQVDDLALVESETNDLAFNFTAFDNYIPGELTENYEYTIYPMAQLREFTMKAQFTNEGTSAASNAEFKAVVYDAGMNVVFTDSASIASMPAATSDSLEISGYTPASMTEDYTVEFTLSSDSVDSRPDDNTDMGAFGVSEYIYAMDQGERDGVEDNDDEAYYLGNLFWIENDAEITGIQVAVAGGAGNTIAGATIAGILLDANLDPVDFTDDYDIENSDMTSVGDANWITLPFAQPVSVFAGEEYLVAIEHFGGADNIAVATSGSSYPQISFIYDQPTDTWFYVTGTPMVRATFDPTVGIEESDIVNGVGLGQNFPNPYTNTTVIPYSLERTADVSLEVHDVTGKLVMTQTEGKRGAGNYRIEMNSTNLVSGIYYYTLVADNIRVTKKMTILE